VSAVPVVGDVVVGTVDSTAGAVIAVGAAAGTDKSNHVSVLPGKATLAGAADGTGGAGRATVVVRVTTSAIEGLAVEAPGSRGVEWPS
jgi:hypothetical protein